MSESNPLEIKYISNSEFQTFKDCRRKWWLAYYRGLRPQREQVVGPAPLGTLVHIALSSYYSTSPKNPMDALNKRVALDVAANPMQQEEIEKQAVLARLMVEGYFEWVADQGADDGVRIIGDEQRVEVPSGTPGVNLLGRLDVRMEREQDHARLFMDHKTVADLTTPLKTLHLDEQMLMYDLIEYLMLKAEGEGAESERCDGAIYNMLKKSKRTDRAKPPFYARVEVRHNMHELRSFWIRLHGTIRDILNVISELESGADPRYVCYPRPSRDCSWKCQFFSVCPLFDDGSHAEGLLESAFEPYDPYARYDEALAELEDAE